MDGRGRVGGPGAAPAESAPRTPPSLPVSAASTKGPGEPSRGPVTLVFPQGWGLAGSQWPADLRLRGAQPRPLQSTACFRGAGMAVGVSSPGYQVLIPQSHVRDPFCYSLLLYLLGIILFVCFYNQLGFFSTGV